jgi:two-component system chemotaxis response regulator CheY
MKKKILVIDDSTVIRKQMGLFLYQFEVIEAIHGLDALDKIKEQREPFVVIFCDINMPHMDGLSFLENLRSQDTQTPVCMLTTESNILFVEKARALGISAWIIKPATESIILDILKKLSIIE